MSYPTKADAARAMNVGDALSREHTNLDGADDLLGVARSDPSCGFRVQTSEQTVEILRVARAGFVAQAPT